MLIVVKKMTLIVKRLMFFIERNHHLEDIEREKVFYGLQGLYSTITKTIVILLISFFINNFYNTILFMLSYLPLRTFSYGLHFSNSKECWIFSLVAYLLIPLLITKVSLPSVIIISIMTSLIPLYLLWAPADTKKRPFINKNKRFINKSITVFVLLVYIALIKYVPQKISISLFLAVIFQILLISPLVYKIFKQPYRNYLMFDRKERR